MGRLSVRFFPNSAGSPCRSITEIEEAARRLAAEGFEIVSAPEQQGATCLIGQVTEDIEDGEYERRSQLRGKIWEHEKLLSRANKAWKQVEAEHDTVRKKYDEARVLATASIMTSENASSTEPFWIEGPGSLPRGFSSVEDATKFQNDQRAIMDELVPDVDAKREAMTQRRKQAEELEQEISRLRMALLDPNSE